MYILVVYSFHFIHLIMFVFTTDRMFSYYFVIIVTVT